MMPATQQQSRCAAISPRCLLCVFTDWFSPRMDGLHRRTYRSTSLGHWLLALPLANTTLPCTKLLHRRGMYRVACRSRDALVPFAFHDFLCHLLLGLSCRRIQDAFRRVTRAISRFVVYGCVQKRNDPLTSCLPIAHSHVSSPLLCTITSGTPSMASWSDALVLRADLHSNHRSYDLLRTR